MFKMNLEGYIDPNGLVKPNKYDITSGNGILYTSVYALLSQPYIHGLDIYYTITINKCMLKPGLLTRVPDNSQKQETWDDYLGVAAACIKLGIKSIPRSILWYALRHAFFISTTGKLTRDSFLGLFPQVWSLMWVAAFPWLKWPMWPVLWLIQFTFKWDLKQHGEWQLQWVFLEACKIMGFEFSHYIFSVTFLADAFELYYKNGHPFIEAVRIKAQGASLTSED